MIIQDILIITHDCFGEAAINAVKMIAGHYGHLHTVGLCEGEDPAEFGKKIDQVLSEFNDSSQVLVLVDFFGGTPANQIIRLLSRYPVKAISGFNLPFLLDAYVKLSYGLLDSDHLEDSIDDARQSIKDLNHVYHELNQSESCEADF